MLRRQITFENPFSSQSVTEEHYFHISKADLIAMDLEENKETFVSKDGEHLTGMRAKLQKIVEAEDGRAMLSEFKDILRRSYGKKVGDRFVKSTDIWQDFEGSGAYDQLMFELFTKPDEMAKFIQGIIPNNMDQIIAEIEKEAVAEEKAPTNGGATASQEVSVQNEVRTLTREEMTAMDADELRSGLAEGRYKLS